jgi:hypothetical protein
MSSIDGTQRTAEDPVEYSFPVNPLFSYASIFYSIYC